VPSEITPVERRAVKEACSKASEVYLVQQPVMAAVGAGLPIAEMLDKAIQAGRFVDPLNLIRLAVPLTAGPLRLIRRVPLSVIGARIRRSAQRLKYVLSFLPASHWHLGCTGFSGLRDGECSSEQWVTNRVPPGRWEFPYGKCAPSASSAAVFWQESGGLIFPFSTREAGMNGSRAAKASWQLRW